jgi:hypothetical protein
MKPKSLKVKKNLRYSFNSVSPRNIKEMTAEILELKNEIDGILNEIVNE